MQVDRIYTSIQMCDINSVTEIKLYYSMYLYTLQNTVCCYSYAWWIFSVLHIAISRDYSLLVHCILLR